MHPRAVFALFSGVHEYPSFFGYDVVMPEVFCNGKPKYKPISLGKILSKPDLVQLKRLFERRQFQHMLICKFKSSESNSS